MGKVSSETIQQGQKMLYIGLISLVVLHLLGVVMTIATDGWADMDRLYLWRTAVVVVGGLGTLRGGTPVRYIFAFVMILLVVAGIFGFWVEGTSQFWKILGLLNAVLAAFLTYLLMLNEAVADFLAGQQARYFGFSAGTAKEETPRSQSQKAKSGGGKDKEKDSWDAHDDLFE